MQKTENKEHTTDRYIIVRLWLDPNGGRCINASYPPTRMHSSYREASIECERLAKITPDVPYAIFKMHSVAVAQSTPVQWTTL